MNFRPDYKHDLVKQLSQLVSSFTTVGLLSLASSTFAADKRDTKAGPSIATVTQDWGNPDGLDRQAVMEQTLRPYKGESHPGVDSRTLTGKVMCGYQGWFGTPTDGGGRRWTHFAGRNGFQPGSCCIDLWPDVSEMDPDERFATSFSNEDGRPAEVFSPFNRKTVLRHFKWMQEYGIDGVFVQRFINDVSSPKGARHCNVVLDHCREGANLFGRTYAVMYDLSGMGGAQMGRVMEDWKALVDQMQITKDPAYLHHAGKPVVTVWGFGFNDGRKYTPTEGLELVKFLKDDPRYGGCTVMLGVPTYWRTLERDCVKDPVLHQLILKADIVSPWTVGRYKSPAEANRYAEVTMKSDIEWCQQHGKDFLPVVFPGFSWHNMNPRSPLDQIPRLKGRFLWTQFVQAKKAGATMIYQAMFDEVNEGTAIFKCVNTPPVGDSKFVTYEGLPSDFYLRLVGHAARMLRGQAQVTEEMPTLGTPERPASGKYQFDATISRPVLENFLARSISMEGMFNGRGDLEDNIRMLKSIGVKYAGRSLCLWGAENNFLANLERARQQVPKAIAADPEIVLEACVFETVSSRIERIAVPDWVFTAFGQPVEQRNFIYTNIIYPVGQRRAMGNAQVPDVSRLETQLWFYYQAASYIDLGFEGIHFGQVEIMNRTDRDNAQWDHLLTLVRSYAAKHARRHMVLCNGHTPSGGLTREGRLLLDFHAFPLRIKENPDKPLDATLQLGFSDGIYNKSKGGITFSSWKCEHLPYLVELDNWGVSRTPGQANAGGIWIWGYDEITWFAHQTKQYRADWLRYAWDWVRKTDPNGYLQMPGSRTASSPDVRWYFANNPGPAVPNGFGDEDAIRAVWEAAKSKGLSQQPGEKLKNN